MNRAFPFRSRARSLVAIAASLFWILAISPISAKKAKAPSQPHWRNFVNYQATADLSARGVHSRFQDQWGGEFTLGLDAYGKISNWDQDLATFVLQLYSGRIENHPIGRPGYNGRDDWDFFAKIASINFHVRSDRRLNLKVGHFELPYGLEASINSNGTLRQFSHPTNLGQKLDWGATLNGTFPKFQYEIGLSRGSGIDYESRGSHYALAGRIGTPIDTENFWGTPSVGLSFYQAKLLRPNGSLQDRWRVGIDGQYYIGPVGLLGELSAGETESETTINSLAEFNLTNSRETFLAYNQLRWIHQREAQGWDDSGSLAFGVRYAPDTHWALSAQFTQQLWQLASRSTDQILSLQMRYRF